MKRREGLCVLGINGNENVQKKQRPLFHRLPKLANFCGLAKKNYYLSIFLNKYLVFFLAIGTQLIPVPY